MSKIYTHFQNPGWNLIRNIYWNGKAFEGAHILDDTSISGLFSSCNDLGDFVSIIKQLNGFYAMVQNKDGIICAAVDRVRSIPIFYSLKEGSFYISCDPHWIQEKIQSSDIDEVAAAEFMLTGYVTGKDTLYRDIKQLQAGEALTLDNRSDVLRVKTVRYNQYIPGNYSISTQEEIFSELDQVLLRIFERLIKFASGRTIVIPLSGGYDSRLIAVMLKRLGYKNLIAFSYGKRENKESEISKKVAESLGIKWEFVPYSNEDWHRWYLSEEFENYSRMAGGLSSVPHIQDWPAVWELKRRELIPEDSIFVPGHGADILSGRVTKIITDNPIDPIEAIFKQNYSLWKCSSVKYIDLFKSRIFRSFDMAMLSQDNVSIFESWRVRERHAKFIINSLRAYEFWNYSWWIPFWDTEYMDFWSRIPTNMKLDQKIYKSYVNKAFGEIAHRDINLHSGDRSWKALLIRSGIIILKETSFLGLARKAHLRFKKLNAYESNHLAFYGVIDRNKFNKLYTGIENINSFLAMDIIGSLYDDSEEAKIF